MQGETGRTSGLVSHQWENFENLYILFKPGDYANETASVSSMQSCIRDVQTWMLMDRLKLNPDKTEFLILGTRQQLEKVITSHLVVGESRISPSTKDKNLGSWFDSNLDMLSHVNNICNSSFNMSTIYLGSESICQDIILGSGMRLCWYLQPSHGTYLHLVTEPFSRQLPNCGDKKHSEPHIF